MLQYTRRLALFVAWGVWVCLRAVVEFFNLKSLKCSFHICFVLLSKRYQNQYTKCTGHKIYLPLFPTYSINNVFHSGKYLISWSPWKLSCWDCGFESCQGHGCLSLVSFVCCHVVVFAASWLLLQRSATVCGASLCLIYKPREWGGHCPRWAAGPKKKKYGWIVRVVHYFLF